MEVDEAPEDRVPRFTETLDLEEFRRQLIFRIDARIARIRQESNTSIAELSRAVQGQLQQTRDQVARLGEQVQAGSAHSERVRLQVVALGPQTQGMPRSPLGSRSSAG